VLENDPEAFFYRGLSVQEQVKIGAHPFHALEVFSLITKKLPSAVGRFTSIGGPTG
jgi:hypothetical protein